MRIVSAGRISTIAITLCASAAFAEGTSPTPTPIALTLAAYTQNFDTLVNTGSASYDTLPVGFQIFEGSTGAAADGRYVVGTGSDTSGGAYSFGTAASTDRALGSLGSGGVTPIQYGAFFTNATGATITSLALSYAGEQWRNGAATGDSLTFQYSLNATAADGIGSTTPTWTSVSALDFASVVSSPINTMLNGNLAANRSLISSTISGLSIASGSTFAIRWTDVDSAGADDGLAIDDLSLTAGISATVVPEPASWTMMVGGFGLLGAALRRRRAVAFA